MCQFAEAVVSTSEEKKAPPYMERLQKEHCTSFFFLPKFPVSKKDLQNVMFLLLDC